LKSDNIQTDGSDETFLKLWAAQRERQQIINKQLQENEKSYNKNVQDKFRQIEESENKFLLLMGELICLITGKKG